jgi:hypothetical protein
MRLLVPAFVILLLSLASGQNPPYPVRPLAAPPVTVEQTCAPLGSVYTRTTLYFGLSEQGGTVSEAAWQNFLQREVTPRFPEGLTVWQADGQWRRSDGSIGRERAKVLLLVHEQNAALGPAIAAIVQSYKRQFHQESVLWETAPVCAAF